MKKKIVSADDAVALIDSGATVTTSGFVGIGVPEALLIALERRFLDTGAPRDLCLVFAAGQGDGKARGLNHLGHDGLVRRVIGGHWGLIPKLARLALEGRIEGYNLPQGVISHMFRDIAAGRPGTVSKIGLETFVDPRLEGGRIGAATTDEFVQLIELGGAEHLFYPALPIHVALLRGTTADAAGNVSMEHEALTIDNLAQAMAARNSGGVVIVQVERTVARGALNPRDVVIPGILVDAVVVAPPEQHMQTFATAYSPAFAGAFRVDRDPGAALALDARKVIARRAAFELPVNGVVNLGIGMPEGVAAVAAEEGLLDHLTLTAEPGIIGGEPASGLDFGAASNTDCVIDQNQQFDFYDGGGLDMAVLGMAQADATGSVNVSRFGSRLAGAGGFINISQSARAVVFAGTFTSGGLEVEVAEGGLRIAAEGRVRKFLKAVEQITFSGPRAAAQHRPVLFVTERCVFELDPQGVRLTEIAPGIDLQREVLDLMDFRPVIEDLREMDARIFDPAPMDLRRELLHLDLEDRIALDADGTLFVNFEKLRVRSREDVERIVGRVTEICAPLPGPVDVIVNYDGTRIDEDVEAEYLQAVAALERRFYATVTRYSGSAFMRRKLGDVFARGRAAHVFESVEEARAFVRSGRGRKA